VALTAIYVIVIGLAFMIVVPEFAAIITAVPHVTWSHVTIIGHAVLDIITLQQHVKCLI
jgi:hypothetical protein